MIHLGGARDTSLMFQMAGGTFTDVGVESAGLPLQGCQIVGVTNDAVLRFDAVHRRVACGAMPAQMCNPSST